jgi:hypothetical protein
MTTYDEGVVRPRRRGPAFGNAAALPRSEKKEPESRGPLTKRVEAALGVGIFVPTLAAYAALAYSCYLAVTALF